MRLAPTSSILTIAACLTIAPPALAQAGEAPPTAQDGEPASQTPEPYADEDVIVVYGARLAGEVRAPQPPLLELGEEDIAAYGVGSIAELIQQLGPEVSSARGRGGGGFPVILVNGVRISSFRELRSYPPEAIEKFEVFPEEVAQQYGYSPDQRVVNVILKKNFSSREIEVEYGQPFDGGFSTQEVEATYLRIDGPSRLNVNLEWNNSSALTEAARGVVQSGRTPTFATDPDPAASRTLVADSAGVEATVNWSTTLGAGNSLSLNSTYERDDRTSLQGLDTVLLTDPAGGSAFRSFNAADPLGVARRGETYGTAATLDLALGDWQVTGTTDFTYADNRTRIDRRFETDGLIAAAAAGALALDADLSGLPDAGFDEALSDTYTVNALATARSNPLALPAGDVSTTLKAGYRWNSIASQDTRNPGAATDLSRSRTLAGVNFNVPLTSDEFGGALGDISLNAAFEVSHLSDFGTLTDRTLGLVWGITDTLTASATWVRRDDAPSLTQLGAPEIATVNVPVFDLVNNETVLATVLSGGNPLLPAQDQDDWKFGLQWELPFIERGSFSVDYIRNRSSDVAASFPVLTPAIEAAFPGRVQRDASGRLVQLDERPVTYAGQREQRLQFGLNLSGSLGSGGDDRARGGEPRSGSGGEGGRGRGGGRDGAGEGDGEGRRGAPGGAGGPPGGLRADPERFAQLRATFCEADADALRERFDAALVAARAGEPAPAGPDGQPLTIPPQMLERLTGEDGRIDPERFNAMRERICSADGPPQRGRGQGAAPGGAQGESGGASQRGARGGGGGPGLPFMRGRGGRGGDGGGRWFVNLQYTLELESEVTIAPGVPLLDLLDGDAIGGGGLPRHSGSLRIGSFIDGFGLIANARYIGSSRIDGTGLAGSTDLRFGDYATVDLRAFADLGQRESLVAAVPFLEGSRIGIAIDNLFDTRQVVLDSAGFTPLRYQPFLIDPVGRRFEVEFRKLF